jgi:glycolate oxidase iron-sulfur subunit
MRTEFSLAQLADPDLAEANGILRACVHCGFCTATCPTYVLLGDELDSPRGRIYLIKEMLEKDQTPTPEVVKHVDRCLSCLSCMTTCPSGVNYMHLVDQARARIEQKYRRPLSDRLLRALLAWILPNPALFRISMILATLARPLGAVLPAQKAGSIVPNLPSRLKSMLLLAPHRLPPRDHVAGSVFSPRGERRGRVALLQGCAQQVLAPRINRAAINFLTRHGVEVVLIKRERCCGALSHHLGREEDALHRARANVTAWSEEGLVGGLDAILTTTSGCGTVIKDYGYMLRTDSNFADKASKISALTKDITEYVAGLTMSAPYTQNGVVVAYHSACSLQHGQKIKELPETLLSKVGFLVRNVPEGHLCCGSAGTYNIMQPEIAARLRERKIINLESVEPDLVAAGNIGCMVQIASGTSLPVLHTIELLDWATGGNDPPVLPAKTLAGLNRPSSFSGTRELAS